MACRERAASRRLPQTLSIRGSMKSTLARSFVALVVSVACASCIAWRGDLPLLDPSEFSKPEHPQALTFEVVYRSNGESKDSSAREAEGIIKKVLEKTGLFASVESSPVGSPDLTFQIDETFNEGAVSVSAFLCGFTFFVFPAFGTAEYSLEAE